MATRKSFNETDSSNQVNSMFSDEEIQKIIEENKKLKKQNYSEEDREGKNLWGYLIALTPANNKNSNSKGVDFGHNGIIYHVDFGTPKEVPCSVVETLELHIKENTITDPSNGRLNITNIHYTFSKIREIWR